VPAVPDISPVIVFIEIPISRIVDESANEVGALAQLTGRKPLIGSPLVTFRLLGYAHEVTSFGLYITVTEKTLPGPFWLAGVTV
jgi:hypothetical protein